MLHAHDLKAGAFGVILNRPLLRDLGELEARFRQGPLAAVALYEGGPVQTDRLALGSWQLTPKRLCEVNFGVDEQDAARLLGEHSARLRAYVGHAGWSPGQLEDELRKGAWVVAPLTPEAETLSGEDLWLCWLRRQCPELGLVADAPGDLGLN